MGSLVSNGSYVIGQMKQRVTIQNLTQTPDGQGGFTESYSNYLTVWAWIRPAKAYEKMQMGQTMMPITHRITIRWQSGVSNKQRMLFGTRIFNIKEVINLEEQNKFIEIQAIEQQ